MALCRFADEHGTAHYALFNSGKICPLKSFLDDVPVDGELFSRDPQWLGSLRERSQSSGATWSDAPAKLLPPVPLPEKILCIGLNYRDHAIETGAEIPSEPVVFSKFNTAIIGHGDAIQLPHVAHEVDYEAELVVVIGRGGKHIHVSDAMKHVFGYTCGHDVSARDWQKGRPGGQWLLGKTFDTFAPLGPCLATTDEIPDPSNLRVRMHLNGQTVQDSTTAQLIFNIPTLIAHLSTIVTLRPGDLIFTGTPPGVGAARQPPVYLRPGDLCSVEIDGIGTLQNRCQAEVC
jgi:2-keto-4-pentenoate hydratase/2-oxohepta-3-ene-1,7-dioic acid hydratase in catechol pathway